MCIRFVKRFSCLFTCPRVSVEHSKHEHKEGIFHLKRRIWNEAITLHEIKNYKQGSNIFVWQIYWRIILIYEKMGVTCRSANCGKMGVTCRSANCGKMGVTCRSANCGKMGVTCRSANCGKMFSTSFNRNKHEKAKGHGPKVKSKTIHFDVVQDMYLCSTENCRTKSKFEYNIVTFIPLLYWKLTIEFVSETWKYFSYCSFKMLCFCFG